MGQRSDNPDREETRTTVEAEAERRARNEREQAEHPELLGDRHRATEDGALRAEDRDARPGGDDDRLRARRNEDVSEG